MNTFAEVKAAVKAIDAFDGPAADFVLCLAESLHDPLGLNVAVVTDHILGKGWEPESVERRNGYRVYRYQEAA